MKSRGASYRRTQKPPTISDWSIIAHLGKTPKGKIRLYSVAIARQGEREMMISENLPQDDPRYVFDDDYKMRKAAHEIVRKSGQYSTLYNSKIKIVYDRD